MKNQYDLWRKYITETVPMAEAAGINPWKCVKDTATGESFNKHPEFTLNANRYTFALTVLERKPVFVGDKVFSNNCTKPLIVKGLSKQYGYLSVGECADYAISILSWTPPTKKRTFMLGDKELPCPLKNEPCADNLNYSTLCNDGHEFYFESCEDKTAWRKAITYFLASARDKE